MKKIYMIFEMSIKFNESYYPITEINKWGGEGNEFHTQELAIHYLEDHIDKFEENKQYFVIGVYQIDKNRDKQPF